MNGNKCKTMKRAAFMTALFLLIFAASQGLCRAGVGILNGLTHARSTEAGTVYEGLLVLNNTGDRAEEVQIYQTDYRFLYNGKKFYEDPGQNPRSNATWISFAPERLRIPAQEQIELKYEVMVPRDSSLKGTYWSVLMVEVIPPAKAALSEKSRDQISFGITQVFRYAVQIVTHIGSSGERNIRFLKISLEDKEDKRFLIIDVENTGEHWLRPFLTLELFDSEGNPAGTFDAGRWRIYPGTSVRYQVDLSQVAKGQYSALILVDNKDENVFGAQYSLDITSLLGGR
jgi:hypothetical protein